MIDFIAQFTCGAALKSLIFKCELEFRETISFWKVACRHATTLVSLSAPWWYPTTDMLRRLGTDFTKLEDLTIGRMCSLDVCSYDQHSQALLNNSYQLTCIGLFCCLRRMDVYNHDRLEFALTRNHIRALLRQACPSLTTFGESQINIRNKPRIVTVWEVIHSIQAMEECP